MTYRSQAARLPRATRRPRITRGALWTLAALALLPPSGARAATVQPQFDAYYTLVDLGPAGDVHPPYGGLTFVPGDSNAIVLAGWATTVSGYLYQLGVTRDASGTIDGFASEPALRSPMRPVSEAAWSSGRTGCCSTPG